MSEPSIFVNQEDEAFGQYKGEAWFDIAVFHPRSKRYDRPSWMVYGDRTEVEMSLEEADIECPCLVFSYKSGEKIGSAVPYDIQETTNKKVKLVLDKSSFEIVIWNEEGKSLKTQINVSNR